MNKDPFKTHGNEQLDVAMALDAFNKICTHGEKAGDWYVLEGVKARPSEDGYTVYLADRDSTVSIFFHNKFSAEFKMHNDYANLIHKLHVIESNDYSREDATT